jgi:hypothetical protein
LSSVRDLTPEIWALQARDELIGTDLLATGGLERAYEAYDHACEPHGSPGPPRRRKSNDRILMTKHKTQAAAIVSQRVSCLILL